ncbi:Peptidase, U32 family [Olavius sp. associated proteobacterium Delta 1]|nr:Peptidase, U32 family [Olavius sp. associated proteobacterium Delta 1]
MNEQKLAIPPPEILAPAGNKASFLAAIAARADAIYCGLKLFSARMEAKNFTLEEFIALVRLAHKKGVKVFVAFNSLLKPGDLAQAGQMLDQLQRQVKPDAIIIQDLALLPLVRQTGFRGEIHLSTLANVSFPRALQVIRQKLLVDRVVLPRELNIDELKALAQVCPRGLDLEVFIHGALCYGVSGRCYWSSFLGGKSSLRGRCVQPCRRQYSQNSQTRRYFSCQDLSVDVLAKLLLSVPQIRTWKIEGRKKGPHYVYYTVCAYRMLRDHGRDPKMKKNALQMLEYALGRNTTHYFFLPQRPQNPVDLQGQTGSGMLVGRIKGSQQMPYFNTREELLPGDVLRLGYEDQAGHMIKRIARSVPKGGRMYINPPAKKGLAKGAPAFLTDRREKSLDDMIADLQGQLDQGPTSTGRSAIFKPVLPKAFSKKIKLLELPVYRSWSGSIPRSPCGIWLSGEAIKKAHSKMMSQVRWWLPPVIWPANEEQIYDQVQAAIKKGARYFVLNAAWQIGLFASPKRFNLWAGPFCNLANSLAIASIDNMGFNGAIVSPELDADDFLRLPQQSPIPLGIVIAGNWPLCVARSITQAIQLDKPFASPRGEQAWATRYGPDYWVYPNWRLDLQTHKKVLQKAGYSLFVNLFEAVPKKVKLKKRPGEWNWKQSLT